MKSVSGFMKGAALQVACSHLNGRSDGDASTSWLEVLPLSTTFVAQTFTRWPGAEEAVAAQIFF